MHWPYADRRAFGVYTQLANFERANPAHLERTPMIETIQTLTEAFGPSGYEEQIREIILDMIDGLADEIEIDAMGNLIAWRYAADKDNAPRVMLSAHMDEIGVMVTHVDEQGFVRFTNIGGVGALISVGQRVRFADGRIGTVYVEKRDDTSKVPAMKQLYIDAENDAEEAVNVGDVAIFEQHMVQQGRRITAKSLDDRIGCAIQVEIMRALKDESLPSNVAFVFSVQEEVGLRGAQTAAYGVDPIVGIAIDVTRTGDKPKDAKMAVKLGGGPAVKIKDARFLAAPEVVDAMTAAADRAEVTVQYEILERGTTDASAMQLVRAGVRAGCLSIPCRYIHSPSETVDLGDVEGAVTLMAELLKEPVQ